MKDNEWVLQEWLEKRVRWGGRHQRCVIAEGCRRLGGECRWTAKAFFAGDDVTCNVADHQDVW
ncbi:MAG: hypothetical protein IMF16_06275 [Proteobacteria bacterium]|nr:hypothetical protein [Pseudomonadota bacterium]